MSTLFVILYITHDQYGLEYDAKTTDIKTAPRFRSVQMLQLQFAENYINDAPIREALD